MKASESPTTTPTGRDKHNRGKAPGPGSLLWDIYSDLAASPFSTAILLMQAAHPDVGAAVGEYSIYKTDPWGRLFRTGFSMMRFLYGGKDGGVGQQESRDLRALHAHIKGRRPDGGTYHALRPQTFRVVPDTFLDGAIRLREALNRPLTDNEKKILYSEYLDLCLLFGIPAKELEPDLESFSVYYDNLLLNTMTINDTAAFLLGEMMEYGPAIKYLPLPRSWWRWFYKRTFYPLIRTFTLGFLDPRFREKHQLKWTEGDQRRYQRLLWWLRLYTAICPRFLRYHPFALYVMLGGHGVKLIQAEHLLSRRLK